MLCGEIPFSNPWDVASVGHLTIRSKLYLFLSAPKVFIKHTIWLIVAGKSSVAKILYKITIGVPRLLPYKELDFLLEKASVAPFVF